MGAGLRESNKPLWQAGSHLRNRNLSNGSHRSPAGIRVATANPQPVDEVGEWMRSRGPAIALRRVSLPEGELSPKTSGVLGAYEALPQATARLFDHFMEADKTRCSVRHGAVAGVAGSSAFLKKVLATPLVHHNFAS